MNFEQISYCTFRDIDCEELENDSCLLLWDEED